MPCSSWGNFSEWMSFVMPSIDLILMYIHPWSVLHGIVLHALAVSSEIFMQNSMHKPLDGWT